MCFEGYGRRIVADPALVEKKLMSPHAIP